MPKGISMNTWFAKAEVEELKWPAQSPELTTTEHIKMNRNTDCTPGLLTHPDLPNVFVAGWTNPHSHAPESSGRPSQNSGGYYNSKRGTTFEMGCSACT